VWKQQSHAERRNPGERKESQEGSDQCSQGGGETGSPEKAGAAQQAAPTATVKKAAASTAKAGDQNACRARAAKAADAKGQTKEAGNTCAGKAGCA